MMSQPRPPSHLFIALAICAFVSLALGGGDDDFPTPPALEIERIYAGADAIIAGGTSAATPELFDAEDHAFRYFDDLEALATQTYTQAGDFMYLEYGVSTINCVDHDNNQGAIETAGSTSAVGFDHNVAFSGTVFLQFVSQCHEDFSGSVEVGDGIYFKGEQWYGPFDYPTTPRADILIDQAFDTQCPIPFYANPPRRRVWLWSR